MSSGGSRPGSTNTRGNSVPELTMSRGNNHSPTIHEPPDESSHLGLWEPKRESVNLELESTRVKLAFMALVLLGVFILAGMASITWVTLAGKSVAELGIFIEVVATPLFGLVMLVVGYQFGHKTKRHRGAQ